MALEKGKKEVFRKTIDTQVPYVPAKSYASIAFDSLKPTLNRIQADEEKTKQANYFFDFSINLFVVPKLFEVNPKSISNSINKCIVCYNLIYI